MALKHRRSNPQGAKASEAIEAAPNAVSKCPIKQIEPHEQGQEPHGREIQLEGAGEPPEGQRGLPLTAQLKPRIGLAQGRERGAPRGSPRKEEGLGKGASRPRRRALWGCASGSASSTRERRSVAPSHSCAVAKSTTARARGAASASIPGRRPSTVRARASGRGQAIPGASSGPTEGDRRAAPGVVRNCVQDRVCASAPGAPAEKLS